MSQERLAELLGVTFQQVQKYEKGANRIAAGRLYDIARALDMPVSKFFEGLTKTSSLEDERTAAEPPFASADTVELVRLYSKIENRAVRRRILELVRAMSIDAG